jgi:NAD(P)-dependent dehydrogenase (short-subunit alcohol dehydrogenase family)
MSGDAKGFYRLDGRTAIVTGGGQSVGEGIAHRLASAGARVAVFDKNGESAAAVAKAVGGIGVAGDQTSESDIARLVGEVTQKLGPIDILVNNAAIGGKVACIWDLGKADMEQVLAVNLVGPFLLARAVIGSPGGNSGSPAPTGMLARKYGRIVNVASIAGKEGNPTLIPYSASKAGLINFTKALAKEVVGKGDITINAISPAVIRTKMLDDVPQATIDYMISKIPMGRTCEISEVASLVHFLASSEASFCTGQCYDISGGRATY